MPGPRGEDVVPVPRFTLLVAYIIELGVAHAHLEACRAGAPPIALALAALWLALPAFGSVPLSCRSVLEATHNELQAGGTDVGPFLPRLTHTLHGLWENLSYTSAAERKWRKRAELGYLGGQLPQATWKGVLPDSPVRSFAGGGACGGGGCNVLQLRLLLVL